MSSRSIPPPGTPMGDESEDAPPSMANSAILRELPSTERGLRTRTGLIEAARTVFERQGYLDTRLVDITTEAKCSAGTFYTYFAGKEEIFAAVLEVAQEDMMHPGMPHASADDSPAAIIEASNRAYFEAYRRNSKLMGLLEQVANIDPEFRKLRYRRGDAFIRRNARSIEALQQQSLADPELDPLLASRALSGMISRLAFTFFVARADMDDEDTAGGDVDIDELSRTCTRLWLNALRISS